MRFWSYDALRVFDVVARHESLTAASETLHLTKGAVGYQINRLEDALGFKVFERSRKGIVLTEKGRKLWHISQAAFHDLEGQIEALRADGRSRITIGVSTYFASRWLSPRLMTFMADNPNVGLRLLPLVDLIDLRSEPVDIAIRWGKGDWTDLHIEPLLAIPAMPTAGRGIARRIEDEGLDTVLQTVPLLQDREDSTAWADWQRAAGFDHRSLDEGLIIPDPNVRVQAVIDDQGLALNDALVAGELSSGRLMQVSDIVLAEYGYFLAYAPGALENPGLRSFRDWLMAQAADTSAPPAPDPVSNQQRTINSSDEPG